MASLVTYFSRLINRLRPAEQTTTSTEMAPRPAIRPPGDDLRRWRVEHDRRSVVEDCRQMYREDPRAEGIINTLARDAVKGGFTVMVNAGPRADQAQEAANRLVADLALFSRLDDWVRLTLRDGDTFLELSVNKQGQVVQVTRKPTLQMHRNSNPFDRFDDPARAYWFSEQSFFTPTPPGDAIWFADWQIVHARWGHDEGSRYGKPLFASARDSYRRIREGELDIAVRRKTRAGIKYLHKVEGDETAIEKYRQMNQDTLDNPFAAIQDFFGNVDIKVIQGDAQLDQIGDVLHHIDTFAFASPVPLALIGYGKELNRDILEQKLEQYERALEPVTQWVEDQLLRPLLEMQWLLLGIWPPHIEYEIAWASKKILTADSLRAAAEAGLKLRGLQWPDEMIVEILAPLIPGLDAGRLLAAMAAAKANLPDEIDRLAAEA